MRWGTVSRRGDVLVSGLALVWLLGVCGVALATLDFGPHWDEPRIFDAVSQALAGQRLLPGWYNYPQWLYNLNLAQALLLPNLGLVLDPYLAGRAITVGFYLAQGGLTWWVAYRVSRSFQAAGFALLFYGLSWELIYHAKWVAPDTYLAFWGLATVALIVEAVEGRKLWLWAAVAAALATSAKYTGGVFLFDVLIVGLAGWPARARVGVLAKALLVYLTVFLLVNPGLVVEFRQAWADIGYEIAHYGRLGHQGAKIGSVLEHVRIITEFYIFQLFSPNPQVSFAISLLAVAGGVILVRRKPLLAVALLFPVLFLAGYMALQVIFAPRNHLTALSPLVVAAGVAAGEGFTAARQRVARPAPAVFLAMLLGGLWAPTLIRLQWMWTGLREDWRGPVRALCLAAPVGELAVSRSIAHGLPECAQHFQGKGKVKMVLLPDDFIGGDDFSMYQPVRGRYSHFAGSHNVTRDYYFPFPTPEVVIEHIPYHTGP